MRIAFVADMHGNDIGFAAVVRELEREQFDEIICLGDVAQGGPQPVGVVNRLRELGCRCVLGNSDEFLLTLSFGREEITERVLDVGKWSREQLGDEGLEFHRSFAQTTELDVDGRRLVCCHATPTSNEDIVLPDASRERVDEALGDADLVACGHVHLQWMRRVGRKLWLSVGSAGLVWEHKDPMDDQPAEVGVVILPDVRGLYRFYEELALRFAERGIAAVAIDYFGRTAGVEKRGDEFEYMPHVEQTTPEGVQADTRAAVEYLRAGGIRNVFTVGFCFGGRNSWLAAASGHGLTGAIGFYGRPGKGRDGSPGPADRARDVEAPILALQAGADQHITAADNAEFDRALDEAGVEHELVTYDGAPHSFFDRRQEDFAEASDDAWQRVLAFIQQHAGVPAA